MYTFEKRRSKDGRWRVYVHRDDWQFVYETEPYPSADLALKEAKRWSTWSRKVADWKVDSIYYILMIPETWQGPPPRTHAFSGLHMKIGRTSDVLKRLRNLQTGTSGELIIMALEPGSQTIEQARHKQFSSGRRQGEWFVCSPKLCQHALDTWRKNNLLPPEHQRRMVRLAERIRAYRVVRDVLGKSPDMVNPSLEEKWHGNVFVDLVYTNLAKKGGFYEV